MCIVQKPKAVLADYLEGSIDKRSKLKCVFSHILCGSFDKNLQVVNKMLDDLDGIVRSGSTNELKDIELIGALLALNNYKMSVYETAAIIGARLDVLMVRELLREILALELEADGALKSFITESIRMVAVEADRPA